MNDKRRCHRLRIELPVNFKISESTGKTALATALDVSGLGLRISTKEKLNVEDIFPLQIKTPDNKKIKVEVKVMWVEELNVHGSKEYLAGVQIMDDMFFDEAAFVKFFANQILDYFKRKA
ncbi:MAG: PilZ domain-containing protein [Candidatus Aceula lacicola]|nr:PilZ domain-containing protein [Candidatus Aceula lacicola]